MKGFDLTKISLNQKKYIAFLSALTILGAVLLSLGGQSDPESLSAPQTEETLPVSQKSDEAKLAAILTQVEGAGKVAVQINYKTAEETAYAVNQKLRLEENADGTSEESEETIAFYNSGQGSEKALIVSQRMPEIAGILIVAEGAEDGTIKRELINAAAVLFDIPEYRVSVLKMKGGDE